MPAPAQAPAPAADPNGAVRTAGGPAPRSSPKLNWCITVHKTAANAAGFVRDPAIHTYLIVGDELGEDGVTPHWQIFVQYIKKVRMNTIKAFFGNSAHCEPMRGTAQQVFSYPKMLSCEIANEYHEDMVQSFSDHLDKELMSRNLAYEPARAQHANYSTDDTSTEDAQPSPVRKRPRATTGALAQSLASVL